jgi:hypothetical protein
MVGGRTPEKRPASVGTAPLRRSLAGYVPLVLLVLAALGVAAPDPVPWWVRTGAFLAGMVGAYLAGRAGYAAPGALEFLARDLNRAEARERDYARLLAATAIGNLPPARAPDPEGSLPPRSEPRPSAIAGGGGRQGLRAVPGGSPLDAPLDEIDDDGGPE